MLNLLLVAVGGAIGAVARYSISVWASRLTGGSTGSGFPLGTLLVNVVGCLLLGALMVWVERGALSEQSRLLLGVGLLGALTTFSTFGHETMILAQRGLMTQALVNVAANAVLGLSAVWIGHQLASRLL